MLAVGAVTRPRLARRYPFSVRRADGALATAAAARNRGLDLARGRHVVFWDSAWYPLPALLDYCLDFHERHAAVADALLLHATADVSLRRTPLLYWRRQRGPFPERPGVEGVYPWPHFRVPGLSCKAALFATARFDPAYAAADDLHLGARLAEVAPLRVWFEPFVLGLVSERMDFGEALVHEYLVGYFRRRRLLESSRAHSPDDLAARFADPEAHIRDTVDVQTLVATIGQLEASLCDVEVGFVLSPEAERLRLLFQLYEAAMDHAAAKGWRDAGEGRAPAPGLITAPERLSPGAAPRARRHAARP